MSAADRVERIEEEVDRWWYLKIEDAAERLAEKVLRERGS
jgi:hypothetical protein